MYLINRSKRTHLAVAATISGMLFLSACSNESNTPPVNPANADKVGVLITGWGEPLGFDHGYRKEVVRSRTGAAKKTPWESCTEMYAGSWPFSNQVGLIPYAVAHKVPFLDAAWDSMGVYRKEADGTYTSLLDESVKLKPEDIPQVEGIIIPITESKLFADRSINGIDPRDGKNLLEGIYQIGIPSMERGSNPLRFANGMSDAVEMSIVGSLADGKFMWDDLTVRANPADEYMTEVAISVLKEQFGDRVDARFGAYAETKGIFKREDDVAKEFVSEGFRKLVLARETTDNNDYANKYMTLGYVQKALCDEGWYDDVKIEQTRQVGRTPEYNAMLMEILRPYLERREKGSEVGIIYTTYGMPFPGAKQEGAFGVSNNLAADPYHENAYFNYQAFKRYAKDTYGKDFNLVFNRPGKESDVRTDSYYAYAMFPSRFYGAPEDPLRFPTIRESIDQAKKDGRKDLIVFLSHWSYTNTDNMLAMRKMHQIPYNSREEMRNGKTWIDWCETVDSSTPVDCSTEGAVKLSFTEVFDRTSKEFGIGYGHVLRTSVERHGVLPEGVVPVAKAPVTALNGGTLNVTEGVFKGVVISVPADPAPGKPESFRWNAYEAFVDPAKPFVAAWDDFEAYVAPTNLGADALAHIGDVVSQPVLVGPYRTIMNKPARITLPFDTSKVSDVNALKPFIYNEVTKGWDRVYDVAGGEGLSVDAAAGTVTFDVQIFGAFVLAGVQRYKAG
jgi:hypothetical protein